MHVGQLLASTISTISVNDLVNANCPKKRTFSVDFGVDTNVSLLIAWREILPRAG
jgi:hypothetical protein